MNTCKDCKWWDDEDSDSHYKECVIIKNYIIVWMDRMAGVDFIETGPEFGCVHWEKKDAN